MRRRLAQREFALAAVALLAAVIALAVVAKTRSNPSDLPAAYGSYPARAGSSGTAAFGKRTACGTIIRPKTEGVAHPVLPCGARIYITYNGKHVLHAGDRPRPEPRRTASSSSPTRSRS